MHCYRVYLHKKYPNYSLKSDIDFNEIVSCKWTIILLQKRNLNSGLQAYNNCICKNMSVKLSTLNGISDLKLSWLIIGIPAKNWHPFTFDWFLDLVSFFFLLIFINSMIKLCPIFISHAQEVKLNWLFCALGTRFFDLYITQIYYC